MINTTVIANGPPFIPWSTSLGEIPSFPAVQLTDCPGGTHTTSTAPPPPSAGSGFLNTADSTIAGTHPPTNDFPPTNSPMLRKSIFWQKCIFLQNYVNRNVKIMFCHFSHLFMSLTVHDNTSSSSMSHCMTLVSKIPSWQYLIPVENDVSLPEEGREGLGADLHCFEQISFKVSPKFFCHNTHPIMEGHNMRNTERNNSNNI